MRGVGHHPDAGEMGSGGRRGRRGAIPAGKASGRVVRAQEQKPPALVRAGGETGGLAAYPGSQGGGGRDPVPSRPELPRI